MIVDNQGALVFISEKITLTPADDGAMSAVAEATFAAALALLAISGF